MSVSGLREMIVGFHELQGPELPRVIGMSLAGSMRAVVVPAIKRQMSSDFKDLGSHREPKDSSGTPRKPRRGRGGPAEKNVTVRKVRKRGGELVAIGVGPRAWYAHFPIAGTRPHVISTRAVGARGTDSRARRINRGTETLTDRGALAFGGRFATVVNHPGSRGTNSVQKAVQGVERQVNERYAADLQKAYDRVIAGPVNRARPVR